MTKKFKVYDLEVNIASSGVSEAVSGLPCVAAIVWLYVTWPD